MLRQLTWGDYYYDKEAIYSDRPEILRWHIGEEGLSTILVMF